LYDETPKENGEWRIENRVFYCIELVCRRPVAPQPGENPFFDAYLLAERSNN
jgi:hypothetical protein